MPAFTAIKDNICPICHGEYKRLDVHIGSKHAVDLMRTAGYEVQANETKKDKEERANVARKEQTTEEDNRLLSRNYTGGNIDSRSRTPLTQIKEMMIEQNELLMLQVQQKALMQQLNQQTEKPTDHTLEMFKVQREMIRDEQERQERQRKELLATMQQDGSSPLESLFASMLMGGMTNATNPTNNTGVQNNATPNTGKPTIYSEENSGLGNQTQ